MSVGDVADRGGDADLRELALDLLGERAVGGRGGQRDLQPVLVPGLGEQLLGQRRVVRVEVGELGAVADEPLGERLVGDRPVPRRLDREDRLPVDRVVDRLDHVRVVERRRRGLDVELVDDLGRDHVDLEPGRLGRRDLVARDVGDVDLTGLERGEDLLGLGDVLDGEVGDVDLAGVPVAGVADQVGVRVGHVAGQLERARADRLGGDAADGLERRRADHHPVLAREQVGHLVVDLGQVQGEAGRAVDDDLGDDGQLRGLGRVRPGSGRGRCSP